MTLSQKQRLFTRLIGQLISYAYAHSFELTFGDAFRSPEQAAINAKKGAGIVNSLHTQRLAVDFNLFINSEYITDGSRHKPLGDYWKTLHPLCRWGGDWGDGNHYSMEHNGVK